MPFSDTSDINRFSQLRTFKTGNKGMCQTEVDQPG
jgi:hypothetical protein